MTGYEWDGRCADLELGRLEGGFGGSDFVNFARVLLTDYARVQGDIHVRTGRLRASASAKIDQAAPDRWEGEISVGGFGLRYAASEFFGYAAAHGGYPSHAYFRRIGWQPTPRFGSDADQDGVPWSQTPVGNVASATGVPIWDDMMNGPVASFFSRGHRTPHPEGPVR